VSAKFLCRNVKVTPKVVMNRRNGHCIVQSVFRPIRVPVQNRV